MGMVHGPNMVTDGLVFLMDAGNVQSYPGSGTTWYDAVGSNDGAITGATYSSNNGGYFTFDGTDDYVDFGNTNNQTTNDFSISLWFKTSATTGCLIAKGGVSGQSKSGYKIDMNAGNIGIYHVDQENDVFSTSESGYNNGNWHHIVNTNDRDGNALVYFDGALKDTQAISSMSSLNNSYNLFIGKQDNGAFFNGNINIVKIYNRGLTAAEVLQNYNAHKSRFGL